MDAAELRDAVEDDRADDLALLGSRDLLVAISGGDPDPTALLRAAAHSEYAARETFHGWADTAADPALRRTYEAVASRENDHFGRVRATMDAPPDPPVRPGPMHAYLRGRGEPIHRIAGGMVGRTLVSLRTHDRLIDFFDDDRERATLFRDLRAETATCLADGLGTLDTRAADDDWEAAAAVAGYAVRLAADDVRGVDADTS